MEGAEDRVLGGAGRTPVIDRVNQHRQAERIGQKDELLPLLRADLPGPCQKIDAEVPFILGQVDFAREVVEMLDEASHHLCQARIHILAHSGVDGRNRVLLGEKAGWRRARARLLGHMLHS